MQVLETLKGGLVVSCQPVKDSPMDSVEIIVAMTKTAELSGASAVRVEGVRNVAAVKQVLNVPVIGIVKKIDPDTPVVITPSVGDIDNLIEAGADIVALDATDRPRPVEVASLVDRIQSAGTFAMADCATFDDGTRALELGCSIIGTTLSGYTVETDFGNTEPDFQLLRQFHQIAENTTTLVMAEGRYNTPDLAAAALRNGADCVTVGSAITRIEHIVGWFTDAMRASLK